ncbi:MAG TPA: peptidoglycan-binding protein [Jatrophihabitans sp.]|nr:peptidoglycan-binding protein [Jatrophihabitans sp.]
MNRLLHGLAGLVAGFALVLAGTVALAPAAGAATTLCSTTLQEGDTGSCVTQLQQRLNQLGATLTVDGDFGPATKNAVLAFQGRSKIGFDGIVGPTTQSYLNNPGSVNLNRASVSTIQSYITTVFGSTNAVTAKKIATCESSNNEIALNYNTNSTWDLGVFQDNTVHATNMTNYIHDMLYYTTNIQEAHSLFVAAGGWSPWNSSKSCWG